MHRTTAWLVLVVAAALAAGIAAFTLASPDQRGRVQQDDLGFRTLDQAWLDDRIRTAGEASRRAQREALRERQATVVARRWLAALPGARLDTASVARGIVVEPDSPESARRLAMLRAWSDGVPRTRWRIVVSESTTPTTDVALMVSASLHVRLADAASRSRIVRVPVVLQLAAPDRAGGPWRVQDAQVDAPARGLRAYTDPTIATAGSIDVVAGSAARADAVAIAATMSQSMAQARDRFEAIARASSTTVWVYEGPARLRAVARPTIALRDELHPIARVDADGATYVDLRAWRAAGADARRVAVRHAALHVVLADAFDPLAPALREGIAMAFAASPAQATLDRVGSATSPAIDQLLLEDPDAALGSEVRRAAAHVLGAWLLAIAGEDAIAELVRQRAGGIDADHSVRRALRAAPAGVEARVRAWARSSGLVADDGDGADPGDEGQLLGDDGDPEAPDDDGDGMLAADPGDAGEEDA